MGFASDQPFELSGMMQKTDLVLGLIEPRFQLARRVAEELTGTNIDMAVAVMKVHIRAIGFQIKTFIFQTLGQLKPAFGAAEVFT